jgi:SPX domain protein involved in polyphosphate accumulation
LVEDALVPLIRDAVRPFVRLDHFAAAQDDRRYPICSLYLDTPDLELCRKTLHGHKNRYKLRIRSYSDAPDDPVYLEVKRRVDGVILKCRNRVSRSEGVVVLRGESNARRNIILDDSAGHDDFSALATATGVYPVIRVRYLREAYESIGYDPVRITFDTQIQHLVTLEPNLSHEGEGWRATPVNGTVIEIKFTDRFPSWVRNLVQVFELQKLSVAKYCLSMTSAIYEGSYASSVSADLHAPVEVR